MGTKQKKTRRKLKQAKAELNKVASAGARLGLTGVDIPANVDLENLEYFWETLEEEYTLAAKDLVSQLATCKEMIVRFKTQLNQNPTLNAKLIGVIKSYEDLSKDLVTTAEAHKKGGVFLRGKIPDDDINAQMNYLNILGKYAAIQQSIAGLASSGMLDIMTQVATDPMFKDDETIKNAIADLKELNEVTNEMANMKDMAKTLDIMKG